MENPAGQGPTELVSQWSLGCRVGTLFVPTRPGSEPAWASTVCDRNGPEIHEKTRIPRSHRDPGVPGYAALCHFLV